MSYIVILMSFQTIYPLTMLSCSSKFCVIVSVPMIVADSDEHFHVGFRRGNAKKILIIHRKFTSLSGLEE